MNRKRAEILRESGKILEKGGLIYVQHDLQQGSAYFGLLSREALEGGRKTANFAAKEDVNIRGFLAGREYPAVDENCPDVSIFDGAVFPGPENMLIVRPKNGKKTKKPQEIVSRTYASLSGRGEGLQKKDLRRVSLFRYTEEGEPEETDISGLSQSPIYMIAFAPGAARGTWRSGKGMEIRMEREWKGDAVARPDSTDQSWLSPEEIYNLADLSSRYHTGESVSRVPYAVFMPRSGLFPQENYDKRFTKLFSFRGRDMKDFSEEERSNDSVQKWFENNKNVLVMESYEEHPEEGLKELKKQIMA